MSSFETNWTERNCWNLLWSTHPPDSILFSFSYVSIYFFIYFLWPDCFTICLFFNTTSFETGVSERCRVFWQPLLDLERNGPNLHYSVWWRRKATGEEDWSNVTTAGIKHVVGNTETYVPYEIKIQARNDFGAGPESNVVVGFSGEDSKWTSRRSAQPAGGHQQLVSCAKLLLLLLVTLSLCDSSCSEPTDAPTDLRVSKVHSTSVHVHWKPVDLKSVRGEFKEYRVSFLLQCFSTGWSFFWSRHWSNRCQLAATACCCS